MATISKIKGKDRDRFKILFYLNGKRRGLSLKSKYTLRQVKRIAEFVEEIADSLETGGKISRAAAGFLAEMPEDLKTRFVAAGLLKETERVTLARLFEKFYDSTMERKDSTLRTYVTVEKRLYAFFNPDIDPNCLTKKDGERWKKYLQDRGYAEASICGSLNRMGTVFKWAVEQGYMEANPFKGIKRGSFVNPNRMFYVPMDWYEKLLDACPDQTWRTLLALCRIGGLRNPSETLRLTWGDVDWANQSILVHSPKTEHHSGKGTRLIPMFPELKEQLQLQWEQAEEGGSPYVIDRWRGTESAMRTHLRRIIFRAGLPEWERTFQNLRESRANELWSEYPDHVAAAWMGHSKRIAFNHYLQVTDEQFQKALLGEEPDRSETSGNRKIEKNYCGETP